MIPIKSHTTPSSAAVEALGCLARVLASLTFVLVALDTSVMSKGCCACLTDGLT